MEEIGEYVEILKEDTLHIEERAVKECEAFIGIRACKMWHCFKCYTFHTTAGYFPLTRISG